MSCENEPVHRKRPSAHRLGKPLQAILHQAIDPTRKQGREIVPRIFQPVAAGEQCDGRALSAGQIETVPCHFLGERHRATLS